MLANYSKVPARWDLLYYINMWENILLSIQIALTVFGGDPVSKCHMDLINNRKPRGITKRLFDITSTRDFFLSSFGSRRITMHQQHEGFKLGSNVILMLLSFAQKLIIISKNKIMQTFKSIIPFFVLISFFFMNACKDTSRTAENKNTDTSTTVAKSDTPNGPIYDAAIDGSIVGAAFTKMIHDSLGIKMFEVTLKPGDSLPFHSHPDHVFYLLDSSTVVLYLPGQNKGDTIPGVLPGSGRITGPFNDAGKNIGKTNVRFLEIDFHRPRGTEMPAKPAYDATIDAFTLGGESIQKLADTLGVKMFIATMKPGDTATLHSHPDHTVYVLEGGELAVTFPGAGRQIMKMKKGTGFVGGPFSDAAKNIGKTTVKLLMTHVYRPRVK